MTGRVLVLLLVAAVAWAAATNSRHAEAGTPLSGGSARGDGRPNTSLQASTPASAPSPYWHLERRYVAALKRMGRLGDEVRRLRALQRERDAATKRARSLQAHSEGGIPETFRWLGWAFGDCIHGGEGSWTDPNPPFWGGVQMDWDFMQSYAPRDLLAKGTADHWTPIEQVAVAIIGWSLRGQTFAPWPNTSRACGLR